MSEKGDGHDHNPAGFTMWMAGGGVKGGQVIRTTDELGLWAVQDRLHVHGLHATVCICSAFTISTSYSVQGQPETPTINEGEALRKNHHSVTLSAAIPAEWHQRLRSAKHRCL